MTELTVASPERSNRENNLTETWRDWVGITASIGCAIHCAAMPFVIAYLPMLGLSFLADESFHQWMALVCFLIAMAAFVPGFRTHKRLLPGVIAAMGLVLITGAAFGMAGECCAACSTDAGAIATEAGTACTDACCEHCAAEQSAQQAVAPPANTETQMSSFFPFAAFGPWITPIGGLFLVVAHLLNRRFGCLCGCCEPASQSA
ncbi:MAG: MerC domain-containing protein [Rhodopirellula sp. JB044]|uniref:MerC domain-containing protein n=1 Tax=Rhodopirellula sp. JB044 TaxID=3342844 RepID=UPI00370C12F1